MAEFWQLGKKAGQSKPGELLLEAHGLRRLLRGAELIDDGLLGVGRVLQNRALPAKDTSQLRGVDILDRLAGGDRQFRRNTRGLAKDHILRLHAQRAVGPMAG